VFNSYRRNVGLNSVLSLFMSSFLFIGFLLAGTGKRIGEDPQKE
jgi:hypothetical protein